MAETDTHRDLMVELIQTLQRHFENRDDVYVSGNILLYYVEGNKRRHISPDVMVVFGVPRHKRDYYLLWNEGRMPQVVIEVTSSSTRHEDMHKKKLLYGELGVQEYFLFDPLRDYLRPRLRGFTRRGDEWADMAGEPLRSAVLGLDLVVRDELLRLADPNTGHILASPLEALAHAQGEAERAQGEAERAQGEAERAQGEAERARREAENARREAENARREAENARREAELARGSASTLQRQLEEEREARRKAERELKRRRASD